MSETNHEETARTSSAAESARLSYLHARDAAKQVLEQVKEQATDYYARGKDKAKDMSAGTESMIREHPIKSVLIAAGAGLLVGALIRRL